MAKPKSEVILVSPWIDNITLFPPIYGKHTQSVISLGQMIANLASDYQIRFIVLIRDHDYRIDRTIKYILEKHPELLELRQIRNLHAKMVVTESFALEMSANLLPTSLFRNVETCTLMANSSRSARWYVGDKLGVIV